MLARRVGDLAVFFRLSRRRDSRLRLLQAPTSHDHSNGISIASQIWSLRSILIQS